MSHRSSIPPDRRRGAPGRVADPGTTDREGGQALVEFALVAVMMIVLVAGVFELGRALHASILVSQAAREGARVAMVESDNAKVTTAATGAGQPLSGLTVTIARASNETTVTVTYRIVLTFPVLSQILGRSYLDVRSVMTSRST